MMSQTLNWFVRQTSDVETHIVSVERLSEYSNDREEFPYEKQTDDDDQGNDTFFCGSTTQYCRPPVVVR